MTNCSWPQDNVQGTRVSMFDASMSGTLAFGVWPVAMAAAAHARTKRHAIALTGSPPRDPDTV